MEQEENLTKKQRRELRRQEKRKEHEQRIRKQKLSLLGIWLAVVIVIGGIVASFIIFGSNSTDQSSLKVDAISESDQIKGNQDSKVVLIEYSDFQCPACASYSTTIKRLTSDYSDKITFAYRHFPLKSIHRNAELAAQAAEAAGKQGKFWEMHDLIFEKQDSWSNLSNAKETFLGYAEELGLNKAKFEDDLNSDEVKDKVNSDYNSGQRAGVNATPSFFLNGEKLSNVSTYEDFKEKIDAELNTN